MDNISLTRDCLL